jgi:anti-sigma regulatory factor (Ser/Thr protein kinase)
VRAARRYALEAIGEAIGTVPTPVVESVSLAVSELATNCVRHAGTDFTVDVEVDADRVRVEVSDHGSGVPTLRAPGPSEPSGRGLGLVREVSETWGITASSDPPGKSVWFTVRIVRSDISELA